MFAVDGTRSVNHSKNINVRMKKYPIINLINPLLLKSVFPNLVYSIPTLIDFRKPRAPITNIDNLFLFCGYTNYIYGVI